MDRPTDAAVDGRTVGVGPWAGPWPADSRFDPELLAAGDTRNVVDRYRYWTVAAIVADLDTRRRPFHVAVENLAQDFNTGSIVRSANAFGAAAVHLVGRSRWNRRGAMVTDRYLHLEHHPDVPAFAGWAAAAGVTVVGLDTGPGAVDLTPGVLPRRCVLLFGAEGPGLSATARAVCSVVVAIPQVGSTRSINVGAAAAVAMYAWVAEHAPAG